MRKGVSPIIAVVILIAIVVASSALFFNFYGDFQRGRQQQIEDKGKEDVNCVFASIDFDKDSVSSNLTTASDTVNVTIDNTGSTPLYDFQISLQIGSTFHNYEPTTASQKTLTNQLERGERTVLITNVTEDISGTLASVRIVARSCPQTAIKKVELA